MKDKPLYHVEWQDGPVSGFRMRHLVHIINAIFYGISMCWGRGAYVLMNPPVNPSSGFNPDYDREGPAHSEVRGGDCKVGAPSWLGHAPTEPERDTGAPEQAGP